jgi:hypothetical protein
MGTARKYSDIDLGFELTGGLDWQLKSKIANAFDESNLPYLVDLIDFTNADAIFLKNVNAHKELIFEDLGVAIVRNNE